MDPLELFHSKKKTWMPVYDITYDNKGYPHFLIYEDGQWKRVSAKHFKPNPEEYEEWMKAEY